MSIDKITQFELLIIELNRNISYKEHAQITQTYNNMSTLYQEILKTNISINEKNRLYDSIVSAHDNIQNMGHSRINIPQVSLIGGGSIVASIFLLKGPEITGMAISTSDNILTPIARFAPAVLVLGAIAFFILRKKYKK